MDTDERRIAQPPCDCGTCEIWKSLHDEALAEIDRLEKVITDLEMSLEALTDY